MERESASGLLPMTDPSVLPTFDVALRGYERRQVDEYLERIERDLAITQADRAAAVSHARAMEQRLTELQRDLFAERERLVEAEQPTYAGLGAKAEQFLRIAEEESARLRAEAERDAAGVRAGAETILNDAEAKAAAAEALVEQRTGEATTEAARIVSEASAEGERLRREAEQQGTTLIQSARSEAEGLVAQAKAEAERIVAAGRAATDQDRAVKDKEIAALLRRRTDITRQLKTLRDVIGSLPDNDEAAEDEPAPTLRAPAQAELQAPSVAAAMAPAADAPTGESVVGAALRDTAPREDAARDDGDRPDGATLKLLRSPATAAQEPTRQH